MQVKAPIHLNRFESLLLHAAVKRLPNNHAASSAGLGDGADYDDSRTQKLLGHFRHFSPTDLMGKRVLDFGCGNGALARLALQLGATSVVGLDLARRADWESSEHLTFVCGDVATIPLPDRSVDVVLNFCVQEHVMEWRAMLREWRRILTPRGHVLIYWVPYWHPYGHHLHTLIPLPWIHALFGDASLFRTCAAIYERPDFPLRFFHRDSAGRKKPNPYVGKTSFDDLNKLTTWTFEREAKRCGFDLARKEVIPFTGGMRALKVLLAQLPRLSEGFCSAVVYDLLVN